MQRVNRRCLYGGLAALLLAAGGGTVSIGPASGATPLTVGVVDFYPGSTGGGGDLGVIPTRFVADELSAELAHAGGNEISVLPRAEVESAQAALGWRGEDVLSFSRLGELAAHLHADRLVVGWITLLRIGPVGQPEQSGQRLGWVNLTVQIFDPAQGRLVWETKGYGTGFGTLSYLILEDTLRHGVASTVAPTLEALAGGGT
jgi:hypothetical protein